MSEHVVDVKGQYPAFYQAVLAQAAQSGASLMADMTVVARKSLHDEAIMKRGFEDGEHLALSLSMFEKHTTSMCDRFSPALSAAFKLSARQAETAPMASATQELRFDQLELMDSAQVQGSVALARSKQLVSLAVDGALTEFNTYISAVMGFKSVLPDRNPLRPVVFVQTLQELLTQTQAPTQVLSDWFFYMSEALGPALSQLYKNLSEQLKSDGVKPVGYVVIRAPDDKSRGTVDHEPTFFAPASHHQSSHDRQETVLTLDLLRRLLVGDLDAEAPDPAKESFSAKFSREFESSRTETGPANFDATVPAALEALQEMKQVDRLVERIDRRRSADTPAPMRPAAQGLGQALSLEVVALMVENIEHDVRLLNPIKEIVKNLEPALLKLALVDPRFFSDKQHPARRLLDEITQRSLAFESLYAKGLSGFMLPLQLAVSQLAELTIEDAGAFEQVLQPLLDEWSAGKAAQQPQMDQAVEVLQNVEMRSLLAEKVAKEILSRPEIENVDSGVLSFLCGPWAQVVAHAQMEDQSGVVDPGRFSELIVPLLWSAQPELTRKNISKLTRVVPKLLAKLREGLNLIDYPALKTSAFFELLMNLQQQAFKPAAPKSEPVKPTGLHASLLLNDDLWVAPKEVDASGYMALPDEITQQPGLPPLPVVPLLPVAPVLVVEQPPEVNLSVGAWVELMVKGEWVRSQLSWSSPHGTLFLFTSAYGSTQSMSRRSRDKLIDSGAMRVVSDAPVVQVALDGVVQTAMLNSLDLKP